jgi:hypothetical protein
MNFYEGNLTYRNVGDDWIFWETDVMSFLQALDTVHCYSNQKQFRYDSSQLCSLSYRIQ